MPIVFDNTWGKIGQAIIELKKSPVANKIVTLRDKSIAHLEMAVMEKEPKPFDIESLGLTINEILDFEDRYVEVAIELGLIVTGSSWDRDDGREIYRKNSETMWSIFSGLEQN